VELGEAVLLLAAAALIVTEIGGWLVLVAGFLDARVF